jgi:hypothetical protein
MNHSDIPFHAQETVPSTDRLSLSITGFVAQNSTVLRGMHVLIRFNSSLSLSIPIDAVEPISHMKERVYLRITITGDEEEIQLLEALDIRDETLTITTIQE